MAEVALELLRGDKTGASWAVLTQTSYFFDGDGIRMRKDDPDGTTLYAGPVEQTIGPGGTAAAEYFDDISGSSTLTAPAFAGAGSSWRRGARP